MSYAPGTEDGPSRVNGNRTLSDGLQDLVQQVDNLQVSATTNTTDVVAASPNSPAPTHQPLVDIRGFSQADRNRLCTGRFVQIKEKEHVTGRIPVSLLLAISPWFQTVYSADPNVSVLYITDSFFLGPLETVIKWLMANSKSKDFVSIPIRKTLRDNLLTMRATRQLGIDDVYTEHIRSKYWGYVTRKIPTFEDITLIEVHALNREDPLYKAMATTLARLRYKDELAEPAQLEDYLAQHSKLAAFMEDIDKEYEAKRQEMKAIKVQREKVWRERQARRAEQAHRAQQRERRAEESYQSAINRLDAAAEGSRVLSEEEIRAIMRRG
ncbi:hypothetical protein K491DRAFT_718449 [Lophiostoma macrostomum CBS 122681]|uniref:Uncharacterized protein n=1 Tax=Lophiostoma macrostomum CBS 122681 TaxID=1314788 RepID=A0A6A6T2C7_9PLEO|nr:hypothetical protein K491DRAFT_718449 [Lophiostoma macrostomum CBS 122681]